MVVVGEGVCVEGEGQYTGMKPPARRPACQLAQPGGGFPTCPVQGATWPAPALTPSHAPTSALTPLPYPPTPPTSIHSMSSVMNVRPITLTPTHPPTPPHTSSIHSMNSVMNVRRVLFMVS